MYSCSSLFVFFFFIFTLLLEAQEKKFPLNSLSQESSPYLLQHQNNPVNWHPWGSQAFEKAKKENKPVFLSVGYSTCHWCHVMKRESFENEEIAQLLNDSFICIKVDREERPDIDSLYMTAVQKFTRGNGGWPMTLFLTPEQKPFFGGTYFPPEVFKMYLLRIHRFWSEEEAQLRQDAETVTQLLQEELKPQANQRIEEGIFRKAFLQYKEIFDPLYGGFGKQPKFPRPHNLSYLLRYWKRSKNPEALAMVEKTLRHLQCGGIYDHLGGGFHRYSTDQEWLLPHFEKMLYDQALLVKTLLETYQITKKTGYAQTAKEVLHYVLRDMTSPEGAFYSAEDAESEGEEGKFYVWRYEEIQDLLENSSEFFTNLYSVEKLGNFKEEATRKITGQNILHLKRPLYEETADIQHDMIELRDRLFQYRKQRPAPHKDDKILSDWNGMMISAFAYAGRVLNEPLYLEAAERSAQFLLDNLFIHGELFHRYRQQKVGIDGFLDDYAYVALGFLDLYEATFQEKWLYHALDLCQKMNQRFWDETHHGFFLSQKQKDTLLMNPKEIYDGALPSGNSGAILLLVRLSKLTQDKELEQKVHQFFSAFSSDLMQHPISYPFMLLALDFHFGPAYEIVLAGKRDDPLLKRLHQAVFEEFLPQKVVVFHPEGESVPQLLEKIPFLVNQKMYEDQATAYVCYQQVCQLPTHDVQKLLEFLKR